MSDNLRIEIDGAVVETDGKVVWVNTDINLGRYGPRAVDVHHTAQVQTEEGEHCLDCFIRGVDPDIDWNRFKASMLEHHKVNIPDNFKPKTVHEYAGFLFEVVSNQGNINVVPMPGQHAAAHKDKHRMAAREEYLGQFKK